jgi:rfaE bifunctional protein kinase chain/domain
LRRKELADLVAALSGRRVLIVGDVMLDEYIWGEVQRISPEAPVPVVEVHRRTCAPGGAANVAANVASLGGQPLLGGVVGRDPQAAQLRDEMAQRGIDAAGLIVDEDRQTTTKTRIVAHSQQVVRVDAEQRAPLRPELEDALLSWIERVLHIADACVLSDYAKGAVSPRLAEDFIRLAREAGKPVIVDPKGTDYAKYRGATVVTPNVREAERALNREINSHADLAEVGRHLLGVLEGSVLLITRGAEGMSLFMDQVNPLHIPAVARNVFDVTGAGDTVIGALALALAAGASLDQAAQLANHAAGIVVGKVGTATVTVEELIAECGEG